MLTILDVPSETQDIFVPAFPCIWEQERIGRVVDGGKVNALK